MRKLSNLLSGIAAGIPLAFGLALAINLSAPIAGGQTQSNSSITGRVFDTARRPIHDLWVELLDEVDSIIARTRTDSTGRYAFYRLTNGTFQIRIVTYGTSFAPQIHRVNLTPSWQSVGGRSVNEQVDFSLKPLAGTVPSPARTGTLFAQDVPEAARKAYEQGIALLDEGKDAESAIARLREAVDLFPTYYMALERLGVEFVRQGRHEPALIVLSKALEVNPEGHGCLYALGVAQYRLKKYSESEYSLRKMLTLAPESSNAPFGYYFLGLSLMRGGKDSEAEPHLKQAYQLGGKSIPTDVHMALAQLYSNSKRYKEAIGELELFIKEAPDARDAEKVRAIIKQLRSKL